MGDSTDDFLNKDPLIPSNVGSLEYIQAPITDVHTHIVALMQALGYNINDGGVCFGIACMAAQASLLGPSGLKTFYARLKYINKIFMFPNVTLEDIFKKDFYNLRAFFDGIFLYQSYNKDNRVLGVIDQHQHMQIDRVSDVFNLVKPKLIDDKQLSISKQDACCGCFDQETLTAFLKQVDNHLKSLDKSASPIIMHVGSLDHATAIVYFPDQQVYSFFDSNYLLEDQQQQFESLEDMRTHVWRAFDFMADSLKKQRKNTVALNMVVFTADSLPQQDTWLSSISNRLGVDQLNDSSVNNSTLLMLAALDRNVEVVNKLLNIEKIDINQRNQNGFTALMLAAQNGHVEVVNKLLNIEKIDINQRNQNGFTALMLAAQNGHVEVVNKLLNIEKIDINQRNQNGFTALMLAAQNGHIEVVRLLLNIAGIDINQKNKYGLTALMLAAKNGHIEVVNELLHIKEINVDKRMDDAFTALMLAAQNGHVEVVRLLLNIAGIDINQKNRSSFIVLFEIAAEQGHASVIEMFLEKINNNEQISKALIIATQKGHVNIVEILLEKLEKISDMDTRNKIYNEALLFAAINGHTNIVTLLLQKGANNLENTLTVAVKKLQIEVVNLLLTTNTKKFENNFLQEIANILLSQQNANTILYLAAKKGHSGIVDLLLDKAQTTIDVNFKSNKGETALMWASLEGHIDIVNKLLADPNIDPNIKSTQGHSALVLAVITGNLRVVQSLLPKTDLNILREALNYAKKKKYYKKEIFRFIKTSITQQEEREAKLLSASESNVASALPDMRTISSKTKLPLGTIPADSLKLAATSQQPTLQQPQRLPYLTQSNNRKAK